MEDSGVFGELKTSFEKTVDFVLENGLPEKFETRRSELLEAVMKEVSRRKDGTLYNPNVTSNFLTGRKKYQS